MLIRCIDLLKTVLVSLTLLEVSGAGVAAVETDEVSSGAGAEPVVEHPSTAKLDKTHPDYIRAVLISKITPYVYWQQGEFSSADAPYNLCLVQSDRNSVDTIWPYLSLLDGRKSAGRSYRLKSMNPSDEGIKTKPNECHIYYFGQLTQQHARLLAKNATRWPILTIADSMEELYDGAMMAFIEERGKMKIYVNTEALTTSSLKLKSSLLRIAKKI